MKTLDEIDKILEDDVTNVVESIMLRETQEAGLDLKSVLEVFRTLTFSIF